MEDEVPAWGLRLMEQTERYHKKTELLQEEVHMLRAELGMKSSQADEAAELEEHNPLCSGMPGMDIPLTAEPHEGGGHEEMSLNGDGEAMEALMEEKYEIQESIWDASLLIGTDELGPRASAWCLMVLLINTLMQGVLTVVVAQALTGAPFSTADIKSLRNWRINVAHGAPSCALHRCNFVPSSQMSATWIPLKCGRLLPAHVLA